MSRLTVLFVATLLMSASASAEDPVEEICADGQPPRTWYLDADDDGYGDASYSVLACTQPAGFVANSTDRFDGNADIGDRY